MALKLWGTGISDVIFYTFITLCLLLFYTFNILCLYFHYSVFATILLFLVQPHVSMFQARVPVPPISREDIIGDNFREEVRY